MNGTDYDSEILLSLVKTRLNRMPTDTTLDETLRVRISAAQKRLEAMGVHLDEKSADDTMLVVDFAVWLYQNRDTPGSTPEWLKMQIRQRWLTQSAEVDK